MFGAYNSLVIYMRNDTKRAKNNDDDKTTTIKSNPFESNETQKYDCWTVVRQGGTGGRGKTLPPEDKGGKRLIIIIINIFNSLTRQSEDWNAQESTPTKPKHYGRKKKKST
jgi:hypothetical protein